MFAHPRADSFGAAVHAAALRGLRAGGHDVDAIDLYAEGFRPELSEQAWGAHRDPFDLDPDVVDHARRLRSARAVVLVHPTWWGGQPAILKGWFDRVWTTGVAYDLPPGTGSGRPRPRLRHIRRLVVVTTHGSPRWINVVQGEPGRRLVGRTLRALVHPLARVRWIALYGVDASTDLERAAFLERVEARLSRRGL